MTACAWLDINVFDKANQISVNVYSIFVSVLSRFKVRHMWRHEFEYSVSSRANALWMTVSTPSQAILWHCPCSAIHERIQELLRVVNCKHAKTILYLMHCMSKTERTCMHYMSKTTVSLYAAQYVQNLCLHAHYVKEWVYLHELHVQNFCLYALHVQAKLGVDEAIKPGTGPPRGRLQGKIEDFWFNTMSV